MINQFNARRPTHSFQTRQDPREYAEHFIVSFLKHAGRIRREGDVLYVCICFAVIQITIILPWSNGGYLNFMHRMRIAAGASGGAPLVKPFLVL